MTKTPILQIPIHKLFLPLITEKKRFKGYESGRAAGKSWNFARAALFKVRTESNIVFGCFKGTLNSIADSVYKVIQEQIILLGLEDEFEFLNKSIRHKTTNSYFIFKGLQNVGRLQSLEGVKYAWVEEAQWDYDEDKHDVFEPTIRKLGSELWFSYNPNLETDFVYRFFREESPNKLLVQLNYKQNPYLNQDTLFNIELDKKKDPIKYQWKWEGQCRRQIEGALFKSEWFKYEDSDFKAMETITVNIDPSGSSHENSDACGLTVTGKLGEHYYLFDDQTAIMTPSEWAHKAIQLYYKYEANKIIYESNYGGDIVYTIIKQIDKTVPVNSVRATRGKILRAEPIAALYEQGLVTHIKRFPELEYECTTFTGDKKQKSPNRLDSLVWGLTSLIKKRNTNMPGLIDANMENLRL